MIPVIGFATVKRFDLADRLVKSIDYPVEHLVVIDNSGTGSYKPPHNPNVLNVWVLPMPFGVGLTGAWNLIVKATPYAPYWLMVNDDAWFEPNSLQIIHDNVDPETVNFLDIIPRWSAVVFGEGLINKIGLYDERFYPLYFDDNDMESRIEHHGFEPKMINAKIHHDNSSTLKAGFEHVNAKSYENNQRLYHQKTAEKDFSQGGWSLQVRRDNRWD